MMKPVFVYLMTELALRFGEVLCWTGIMQWKCITPLERVVKRREEGCFINIGSEVSSVDGKAVINPGSDKRVTKFGGVYCVP